MNEEDGVREFRASHAVMPSRHCSGSPYDMCTKSSYLKNCYSCSVTERSSRCLCKTKRCDKTNLIFHILFYAINVFPIGTVWLNYSKPIYSKIGVMAKTFEFPIPSMKFLMQFGYTFNEINKKLQRRKFFHRPTNNHNHKNNYKKFTAFR